MKLVPTARLRAYLSLHEITVDLDSFAAPCLANAAVITCRSSDSSRFAAAEAGRGTMVIESNKAFAGEGSRRKGKSKFVNIKEKTERPDLRLEVQG